jgi:hypothetical protein
MSAIGIALVASGWVLLGVTLLAFMGLPAAGLRLAEHMDAVADGDLPSKQASVPHGHASRGWSRQQLAHRAGLPLAAPRRGAALIERR